MKSHWVVLLWYGLTSLSLSSLSLLSKTARRAVEIRRRGPLVLVGITEVSVEGVVVRVVERVVESVRVEVVGSEVAVVLESDVVVEVVLVGVVGDLV